MAGTVCEEQSCYWEQPKSHLSRAGVNAVTTQPENDIASRLARLERRLDDLDELLAHLLRLADKHPMGRLIIKSLARQ
jgi:hypothetical protein